MSRLEERIAELSAGNTLNADQVQQPFGGVGTALGNTSDTGLRLWRPSDKPELTAKPDLG